MTDIRLESALTRFTPQVDDTPAWDDVVQRAGTRWPPMQWRLAVIAVAMLLTAGVVAGALAGGLLNGTLDRLSAWAGAWPGNPAPREEQRLVDRANARAAAPIPADAKLGLLTTRELDGVRFDLLGFRDRSSLCLRLRAPAIEESQIVKAPATCVFEQLLADLGKPVAVFAAADPFPRETSPGLQGLYGVAADGVVTVELASDGGVHRIPVENNAFLFLYRGEPPRLPRDRLVYRSDVPRRATALDAAGRVLGSAQIMSLKRGYPGAPPPEKFPGPSVVERPIASSHVGWLDRGELRGDRYDWPTPKGHSSFPRMRMIHPNPATSMSVLVSRMDSTPAYCATNVWPLSGAPKGFMCDPIGGPSGTITFASATSVFDAQFPVYYGLVPDGVGSLKLILQNGATEPVPIVDNVFAFQTSGAEPAKLVGFDSAGRVNVIRMVSF